MALYIRSASAPVPDQPGGDIQRFGLVPDKAEGKGVIKDRGIKALADVLGQRDAHFVKNMEKNLSDGGRAGVDQIEFGVRFFQGVMIDKELVHIHSAEGLSNFSDAGESIRVDDDGEIVTTLRQAFVGLKNLNAPMGIQKAKPFGYLIVIDDVDGFTEADERLSQSDFRSDAVAVRIRVCRD